MDGSTPGFPVHHQLPEFTQTHVHRVSDAIRPSHPHPWNPLGKNTEVGCPSLLQRIILTQEEHPGLLHCRQILYHLSYREVTDLGGAQILSQSPPCMPANPLRCVLGINLNPVSRISRPDSSPADHRSPGPALTSSKWPCPTPVSTRQAQWAFHDCSGQVWILFETLQGAPSPSLHPDQDPQCSHGEGGPPRPPPPGSTPPLLTPGTLTSGLLLEFAQDVPDARPLSFGLLCQDVPPTPDNFGRASPLRRLLQSSCLPDRPRGSH